MYSEAVALLITATNHADHNSKPVNHRIVLAKIFTYISKSEKKEKQRIDPTFIDIIQETKHRLADILQKHLRIAQRQGIEL